MASKQIVTKTTQVDIAILGSGLVGMAATIAMHALGLSTVVIDRAPKMAHATRAPAKKPFSNIALSLQHGMRGFTRLAPIMWRGLPNLVSGNMSTARVFPRLRPCNS